MTSAEENSSKLAPCAESSACAPAASAPNEAVPGLDVSLTPLPSGEDGSAGDPAQLKKAAQAGQLSTENSTGGRANSATAGSSSRPNDATFVSQAPPYSAPATAPSLGPASLVGQKLDHFEILELIGGGGMGLVFRAHDAALDRVVAVKILSTNRTADEETIRRFRNEAQSAARLDHENIARVYYVGEARSPSYGTLNYIVLEYIDGWNLRDMVAAHGPLSLDQALGYALQLAHALDHASSRSIVHRDIKPSNVLVTHEGRAKLVDMGLSRLQEAGSDDLTASGVTLGTFDYISPEQARDPRNADVRSDIYSLGCTLYYLLTGQPPFPSGNAMQKLLQHQGDEPPELTRLNPTVPEALSRIVRKMLAKDPRRRYQEARSLIVDLSLVCGQLGIDFPAAGVTLLLPVRPRWRRAVDRLVPWLVPAAALVLTVLVLDRMWAGRLAEFENSAPSVQAPDGPEKLAGKTTPEQPPDQGTAKRLSPGVEVAPGSRTARETIERREAPPEIESDPPALSPSPSGSSLAVSGAAGVKAGGRSELSPDQIDSASVPLASRETVKEPVTSPPAIPPNVLVVDPAADGRRPSEFATLKAAVKGLSKERSIIELRYTGRRKEKQTPFELSKFGSVTIQAGEGHQPILEFEPTSANEAEYPRRMITLADGQLKLVGVALELRSPPTSSSDWALVSLQRSTIELERCFLTSTCMGPMAEKISFFQVQGEAPSAAMMMAMDTPGAGLPAVSVRMRDCVARGGARLLHAAYPVELAWSNGLAAISEPLFVGSTTMPLRGSNSRLELSNVTGWLPKGLCSLEDAFPPLAARVSKCILVGAADVPLIKQDGPDTLANLMNRLTWSADEHVYERTAVYWRINGTDAADDLDVERWRLRWQNHEKPRNQSKPIWVARPEDHRHPLHEQVPKDYVLRAEAGDLGFRLDDLPQPPGANEVRAAPGEAPSEPTPAPADEEESS